jgi:paraquat-inducible protein B
MSRKANYSLIGAFVVGAVALAAAGVVIFGGGKFLEKKNTYVLHFEGSVKGLSVGAPVVFRGVGIGTVTDIRLVADPKALTIDIPVFIQIEPSRFETIGPKPRETSPEETLRLLIERGLRAQLQMQSFVTGQLMVELDFHPDTPVIRHEKETQYPEIPTIPSQMEQLTKTIEKLPLDELVEKLTLTLAGIERKVNSPELEESMKNLNEMLRDTRHLVENIDEHIGELLFGIDQTMQDYAKLARDVDAQIDPLVTTIEQTAKDYGRLAGDVDAQIDPLAAATIESLKAATATLETVRSTLAAIESSVSGDSATGQEVLRALREVSATARSIRALTDYLKQHPESLLKGKGGS